MKKEACGNPQNIVAKILKFKPNELEFHLEVVIGHMVTN